MRLSHKIGLFVLFLAPVPALASDGTGVTATVIGVLEPLAALLGTWLVALAIQALRAHVRNVTLREALERATVATATAVGEVEQTFVRELKAGGPLTRESALQAKDRAVLYAFGHLGETGERVIASAMGHDEQAIRNWISGLIEAEIDRRKAKP